MTTDISDPVPGDTDRQANEGSPAGSIVQRALGARHRNEIALLLVAVVAIQLFPGSLPPGIYGLGVVAGAGLALNAIGVVLVYRSNGFVNFAQVAFGAQAAVLFSMLVRAFPILRLIGNACSVCVDPENPGPLARNINYAFSLALGLGLSVLLAWATYVLVVRRFRDAPPLMLMVATVFVQTTIVTMVQLAGERLITSSQREEGVSTVGTAALPFDFTINLSPSQLHATDVFTVVFAIIAVAGIATYLRVSAVGNAIRAASENSLRARTLGIPVDRVTSRVWIIAGLLSGIAGHLQVMASATAGTTTDAILVQILVVAVIARLTSVPIAAGAAIAVGVVRQAALWGFGSSVPLDGSLWIVLGVVLLLQRQFSARVDADRASALQAAREIRPIPKELRNLPAVKKWLRAGALLLAIPLLGAPWASAPATTNLGSLYMIYAMIAFSLLILTGWAGQISLGQFAFAAVGAYVAAVSGWPMPIALVAGGLAGALLAVVVGVPALRLRSLHLAISTLAFALAVVAVLLNPDHLGRHLPARVERPALLGVDLDDQRAFYYVTLVLLIAVFAAVAGLRRSRTARALIAARDNEAAAQSFAINLMRARLQAFAVSGFLAAFAGALLAFHQGTVKAGTFPPQQSIQMFLIAVIGGLGVVWGPFLGALYFALPSLGIPLFQMPVVASVTTGPAALVLVLYMGSGGLAQLVTNLRDNMLRRVAKRHRVVVPSLVADLKAADIDDRAPFAPNERGGRAVFTPRRYRLAHQWAVGMTAHLIRPGEVVAQTEAEPSDGSFGDTSASSEQEERALVDG